MLVVLVNELIGIEYNYIYLLSYCSICKCYVYRLKATLIVICMKTLIKGIYNFRVHFSLSINSLYFCKLGQFVDTLNEILV